MVPITKPSFSVSLVLPAHDEADNIAGAVADAFRALEKFCTHFEVIAVDDGSRDATLEGLRALQLQHDALRIVSHPKRRGYGAALRSGFARARYELVCFSDADRQFDLDQIELLLRRTPEADIVAGYRVVRCDPWRRRFASSVFNGLTRVLLRTSLRDTNCAFKLIDRRILADLALESDDFCINAELFARARSIGLRVVEVPLRHRERTAGTSTVGLADSLRTLRGLFEIRRRVLRAR